MSLLAYNKTTSPLALAAGSPIVTLPASVAAGSRGPAFNVSGELRGLSGGDYALLQVQVVAGQVEYEWSGLPEYAVGTLIVGSAQQDVSEISHNIYVGDWSALGGSPGLPSDNNDGLSKDFPVATIAYARKLRPLLTHGSSTTVAANTNIRFAYNATTPPTYTLPIAIVLAGGADGSAAPETWIGADISQVGTITSQAGTTGTHAIGTGLSPAIRSGAAATIASVSGSGGTKTMTVTGMSGLTSADVGKFFLFALASTPGNNCACKMTAFVSATSATFLNPQSAAGDASNGAIYWQDWYRHATLRYTNGNAAAQGARKIVGHGVQATSTVTISATPADGNTLVINDGTNAAVTFEWDSNGSVVESPTLKQLVFTGSETFAQLAAILRNKIMLKSSVTPAQLRVNATNRAGANIVKLKNMIPGSVGNTASPTQTGAWATISTFASLATGAGDPLTTLSTIVAFNPAPTVGDTFVIEKPGVIFSFANGSIIHGNKLGITGIKFQGAAGASMTVAGFTPTWNKVEIDANGGVWNFQAFSVVNSSEVPWSQSADNAMTPVNCFYSFHSGNLNYQDAVAVGTLVLDHVAFRIGNAGRFQATINAQRTTFTFNGHQTHNAVANFGANTLTVDNALLSTDSSVNVSGPAIIAFAGSVDNSPNYGVEVTGSKLALAAVTGDGNAKAGVRANVGSDVIIDTTGSTALAGELGEIEMGHETVAQYRTYAEVRVPDQYGSKQLTDGRGNWVRTAT